MKRRDFLKNSSTTGLVAMVTPFGIIELSTNESLFQTTADDALAGAFQNPPTSARAQVWWHWMNGNVTADGITRDLEAMKQIGLGGFQNFDAGTGIPKGPVVYLSKEWLDLKQHAIREANRLGLEFTMHNCPGWSSSGGPWITPELSMQQVSWSETYLSGGKSMIVKLPKPASKLNHYRDVAVIAYPSLPGEASLLSLLSKATANGLTDPLPVHQLAGEGGAIVQPVSGNGPSTLLLAFNQPYQARSLAFLSRPVGTSATAQGGGFGRGGPQLILESSTDGIQFSKVATLSAGNSPEYSLSMVEFPATTASYFRISSTGGRDYAQLRFSSTPKLNDWLKKTNNAFGGQGIADATELPGQEAIDLAKVVDLTSFMQQDGELHWSAPTGNWTVLRVGHTSKGELNRSAPDTGVGLECDKYSGAAIDAHFAKMMESLLPILAPLSKKGNVGLLIDSYEVGMQNWTARFPEEFQSRSGYSLTSYLPALTGRVIRSVTTTERFLWDLRRTQADLMADNYYGRFSELCKQNNITAYTEPYDRGPMEEMQIGARVDVNMGEFWNGLSSVFQNNLTMHRTTKLAASIAHINGKQPGGGTPEKPQVVGAEAFTGEPESSRWQEYPFAMKALGDKMFTQGLNKIVFHRFAHQPHPSAFPGMTMGPWGIHFDRTTTWWNQGRAWLDYLARCQSLLQQGLFVADLAYFSGEEGNQYTKVDPHELNPPPPANGYDYDLINGETIIRRTQLTNGNLTLPDGMSYRVLVLQNQKALSLELLRKLRTLVNEGLVMVGTKPLASLGLRGANDGDAEFNRIATELWGNDSSATAHRLGKGRVYWNQPIQTVLDIIALKPDVILTSRSGDAPVTWIHRRVGSTQIYFLANQRRTSEDVVASFRVRGLQPEIWEPAGGKLTQLRLFETANDRTQVPIRFDQAGSAFIVFRSKAPTTSVRSVVRENEPVLSASLFPAPVVKQVNGIVNNFTISLWAKPELNIMLDTSGFMELVKDHWTDNYAIYPPAGTTIYGEGHAACGLAIGRNGVAVWERTQGKPTFNMAAATAISGWAHIALVYAAGIPAVYVNGKLIQQGKTGVNTVHPAVGQAFLSDGASYFNGDMTAPQLLTEVLTADRIQQLMTQPRPESAFLPVVEQASAGKSALRFWQAGQFSIRRNAGPDTAVTIADLPQPATITGPWQLRFPAGLGAPDQLTLPELISLSTHQQDGVKYFSGTVTYAKTFDLPASLASSIGKSAAARRLFLDLGRVEVIADVAVNGKSLGTLWKRPYRIDITEAIHTGANTLEIKVTNLWPNRLIGDEQLPEPDKYTPGGGASGFASLANGAIIELPAWYKEGKPKPADGRVTFTTWKHYRKDSPLLDSGLIGPVRLQVAHDHSL